jgi:alpha-galactosidase
MPFRRARFVGLDPHATYALEESDEHYRGDALMQSGLPLPQVSTGGRAKGITFMPDGDFSAHLFVFKKVAG